MVTTRRQSKDFESIEPPADVQRKRKRSNDAAPVPSTPQPPSQPSTKRRKKVKSTAKISTPSVHPQPAASVPSGASTPPAVPPAKAGTNGISVKRAEHKAHGQKILKSGDRPPKRSKTRANEKRKLVEKDPATDDDSSEDNSTRQPHPAASRGTDSGDDDEDTDSRYALGSKRKGKLNKPTAPSARRTAEFRFEEDGLEEIDKAEAAIAGTSNRNKQKHQKSGVLPSLTPINAGAKANDNTLEQTQSGKGKIRQTKVIPPPGVPAKLVMFTVAEAIAALPLYKDGTMSVPAAIDLQTRQPYPPLQTGESLSYPVRSKYHLGALGRYGIDAATSPPFSLTVPLSEHSYIQDTPSASATESSRHGLGFDSTLATRSRAPAVRRPNNYCFTFGRFRGRRMDSVPITYLRSIYNSDDYHNDAKLQQAFADLYPKGLYESEAESFTFEKGGFKGKRLDEVPKSYVWGLIRKKNKGDLVGGKKGRGRLERALEVWDKEQLDLTQD